MNPEKTKSYFKKNAIIALLAIIAVGLIALIINNKINRKEKLLELDEISYGYNTFFHVIRSDDYDYSTGFVELHGYTELVDIDGSDYKYVFFHITNSSCKYFDHFLRVNAKKDPSGFYARENAISLGCLVDNKISMVRYGDKYSEREYSLSLDDSKAILSSSKDNPVKIIVRKDLDTSLETEIPFCATIITDVIVVK
jgi:hypothetical protein